MSQPCAVTMWQPAFSAAPTTTSAHVEEHQVGSVISGSETENTQFGNPFGTLKQKEPGKVNFAWFLSRITVAATVFVLF